MVETSASIRATGLVRLLGVLTLLLGIAAMHAGVFAIGTMPSHSPATAAPSHSAGLGVAPSDPADHADNAPADHRSGGHGIAHECAFFILTALGIAIGLILLGSSHAMFGGVIAAVGLVRTRPARAPPPTALTLSQLSILRV